MKIIKNDQNNDLDVSNKYRINYNEEYDVCILDKYTEKDNIEFMLSNIERNDSDKFVFIYNEPIKKLQNNFK